jgi:hypothetical protein
MSFQCISLIVSGNHSISSALQGEATLAAGVADQIPRKSCSLQRRTDVGHRRHWRQGDNMS